MINPDKGEGILYTAGVEKEKNRSEWLQRHQGPNVCSGRGANSNQI